ncbi:MAG: hypothetical protein WCA97_19740 [Terriglobales bacterium]|jgi:hypothetical protein
MTCITAGCDFAGILFAAQMAEINDCRSMLAEIDACRDHRLDEESPGMAEKTAPVRDKPGGTPLGVLGRGFCPIPRQKILTCFDP